MTDTQIALTVGSVWLLGLLAACSCSIPSPEVTSSPGEINIHSPSGVGTGGIRFARNGDTWAALWDWERVRARTELFSSCRKEVYFILFDDQLNLLLEEPIRVYRDCDPFEMDLTETRTGFAVAPSEIGAEFDLATREFVDDSTYEFPDSDSFEPFDPDAEPRREAKGRCPEPRDSHETTYDLEGGGQLEAWLEECPPTAGKSDPEIDDSIRLLLSKDGKATGTVVDLLPVNTIEERTLDLSWRKTGDTISLFVKKANQIFRLRFDASGAPVDELTPIVTEKETSDPVHGAFSDHLYNYHLNVVDSECLILFTGGGSDAKAHSCKSGKTWEIGSGHVMSVLCTQTGCMFALGYGSAEIRFVSHEPAGAMPPKAPSR